MYQVWNGFGDEPAPAGRSFWGFYITNFVFWIGISHAGTLISAILRLVQRGLAAAGHALRGSRSRCSR